MSVFALAMLMILAAAATTILLLRSARHPSGKE